MNRPLALLILIVFGQAISALGQAFQLPTPNRALFESGNEADYFTPTVGAHLAKRNLWLREV